MMNGDRDVTEPSRMGHTGLIADVAQASAMVAPLWPLTSFVAVNPLGGLQHLPFEEAAAEARRWLGARTHLSLEEFRAMHARGAITDHDLRRAVAEANVALTMHADLEIGRRSVDPIDVARLDLLHGPDEVPAPAVADQRSRVPGGEELAQAIDELVSSWSAAFVDEAGVPWAMPGREHGFYRAWLDLAGRDRRLRRLIGREGWAWLARLPERAEDALDDVLSALGIGEGERVDALRTRLCRLPGWSGYAHWHDEWAAPDHHGPRFRLVDLLAVRIAVEAATAQVAPGAPARSESIAPSSDGALLEARVAAVLTALDGPVDDSGLVRQVTDVLEQLSPSERPAIWLAAAEGNLRDRLLALLTRLDPGQETDRPRVQAAFCIDVRSEGLRRHLEAQGRYETLGFAGFFGVPVRWRSLGSPASEARCPVLVSPRHEVIEKPSPMSDANRYLTVQRSAGAAHDAFHAAKGGIGSPFALAEAAGWFAGPLAAVRTLAPTRARQSGRWARALGAAPPTRAAVNGDREPDSGLSLEERLLFAEAIVATMGLRRFAPLVVLCGHGSATVNNPHASSLDCGACGGAPGGDSARIAAAILNDPDVRSGLRTRDIEIPDDTWFVAAEHDTASDRVCVLDRHAVPATHDQLVSDFEADVAVAGAELARERARRLPGDPSRVRVRGQDWAQVRPEWGLAGNAAFVVGPRSVTKELDLACRVFLHSYDADGDPEGRALETILTAPLVVAQWISSQYYFSSVDPVVFGAGDKTLHNPVGGVGVVLGEGGDLQVGLPAQSVLDGERRAHEPLRLLAVVQAPLDRTDAIIERNQVLRELVGGRWVTVAGRSHAHEPWSLRSPVGTWSTWFPSTERVDDALESLEVR